MAAHRSSHCAACGYAPCAESCGACDYMRPDPIAETAREIETREASAPPLADVPFALSAPVSERRAVDGRLF